MEINKLNGTVSIGELSIHRHARWLDLTASLMENGIDFKVIKEYAPYACYYLRKLADEDGTLGLAVHVENGLVSGVEISIYSGADSWNDITEEMFTEMQAATLALTIRKIGAANYKYNWGHAAYLYDPRDGRISIEVIYS